MEKVAHLLYCPFTGLGLYGGYRGKRWLRNRIQIFKQFVIPSIQAQTNQNFILWVSWRFEDRNNSLVRELENYLLRLGINYVFTYAGVCFWDDKYSDEVAHSRLVNSIHQSLPELYNVIGDAPVILMTIQPSDDCYNRHMVEQVQSTFEADRTLQAVTYTRGYVANYKTREVAEWNPNTNPPFYTIKFVREVFTDPLKHIEYAGIKSHEYLVALKLKKFDERGFLVGTHGENISTIFNHPFAGKRISSADVYPDFGIAMVSNLKISISWRKLLMRKLPPGWQRKLRYWLGERTFAKFYDFIRS